MIRIQGRRGYQYAKLCSEMYEQSMLINDVFGLITLTIITDNLGHFVLAIWGWMDPNGTCIVGDHQYILFVCCVWNIVVSETRRRACSEVRNIVC